MFRFANASHPRCLGSFALSGLLTFALAVPAVAGEFFVDPINGSPNGDGSEERPWQTLQQVWDDGLINTRHWATLPYMPGAPFRSVNPDAPVTAGDTLWLANGYHGEFVIRGAYNATPITVAALPGHSPALGRIEVTSGQHWRFSGLTVSPSLSDAPVPGNTLVRIATHSFHGPASDVEFINGELFTVDDASSWGPPEWINTARSGLSAGGAPDVEFRNNRLRNVRHGITISGGSDRAVVVGNTVDGFSADGLRGLSNYSRFEYNVVKDAYVGSGDGDSNHDDGFQSWSSGPGGVGTGEVIGNVLRGNLFINYTDPNRPYRATLQGIGCFDGYFVDWVVENNVVIVDHWHGITFLGMRDSVVANNTLIDLNGTSPGPPWIRITDHKNGQPSSNVLVSNNLSPSLTAGAGVITSNNLQFSDAADHFVNPPLDLHLLPDSPAVNAADGASAPRVDRDGVVRPQHGQADIGAYEYCANCTQPLFLDGFE